VSRADEPTSQRAALTSGGFKPEGHFDLTSTNIHRLVGPPQAEGESCHEKAAEKGNHHEDEARAQPEETLIGG
jgi:hypothetical protein